MTLKSPSTASASTQLATPMVPAVPPAPLVPEKVIDETLDQLQQVYQDGVLKTVLKMGRIIVHNLYGDDLDAWRSRGAKDHSFRSLVQRLGDNSDARALSASFLSRSCGAYELYQRLDVSALQHISATHLYLVLGVAPKVQRDLLTRANKKQWTTRQLEAQVAKHRTSGSERRGRKPLPVFQKGLSKAIKAIEEATSVPVPDDLFQAPAKYGRYSTHDAKALLTQMDAQLSKLAALREQIEARINLVEEGDGPG